jgi:hypothetical protein
MFETYLAVGILAKIKHYKIKYLFKTWTIYPAVLAQCVLIFFEINAICGNYSYVPYSKQLQVAIILSFLFPMLKFQLYKPALVGCASTTFGSLMNYFVIVQNGGHMPSYPTLSYITHFVRPYVFEEIAGIHSLADASVKFWYLTDFIDLGDSILSPGDRFIDFNTFLMLYYTIKAVNVQRQSNLVDKT